MFLDPPVVAAMLTLLAAIFLIADFGVLILTRAVDPRLNLPATEVSLG
jgi:hypothetical protein